MAIKTDSDYGVSSEAVKAKTGREWLEWIRVLDKDKAHLMQHKDIAMLLSEKYGVGDWWCQTVTVGYERGKGLRQVHQTATGFSSSVSKTFEAPVSELFEWWHNDAKRKKWLKEKIIIHKAIKNKSLRITMPDGSKSVSVNFYSKSENKGQVTVQQGKLKDAKGVTGSKKYWKEAFDKLQLLL